MGATPLVLLPDRACAAIRGVAGAVARARRSIVATEVALDTPHLILQRAPREAAAAVAGFLEALA